VSAPPAKAAGRAAASHRSRWPGAAALNGHSLRPDVWVLFAMQAMQTPRSTPMPQHPRVVDHRQQRTAAGITQA
jgi:hypothetical protein